MKHEIGRKRIYNTIFEDNENVIHWEVLNINKQQEFNVKFISTNSKYRQGIRLAIDAGEGYIEINDVRAKELYLWEDTVLQLINVKCVSEEGVLSVYNVFDLGKERGGRRSQVDSCGMIVKQSKNIYRYHCNDVGFETSFDKLVFEIELL